VEELTEEQIAEFEPVYEEERGGFKEWWLDFVDECRANDTEMAEEYEREEIYDGRNNVYVIIHCADNHLFVILEICIIPMIIFSTWLTTLYLDYSMRYVDNCREVDAMQK